MRAHRDQSEYPQRRNLLPKANLMGIPKPTPAYERAYAELTDTLLASWSAVASPESESSFVTEAAQRVQKLSAEVPQFYAGEFVSRFRDLVMKRVQMEIAECERAIEKTKADAGAASIRLTEQLDLARKADDREAEHAVWRERELRQAASQAKIDAISASMDPIMCRVRAAGSLMTALGFG